MATNPKKINIQEMQNKLDKNIAELSKSIGSFRKYIHKWEFNVKPNFDAMAGVGKPKQFGNVEVLYSDWGIDMLKDAEVKGITIHEILHIYNNHFTRMEEGIKDITIKIPQFGYCPSLWNVATDLAINYTIENYFYFNDSNIKLPKGCLSTKLFPADIKNEIEDMPAEHIFEVLKEKYQEDTKQFEEMMRKIVEKMIQEGYKPQQGGQQQQGQGGMPMPIPSQSGQPQKGKGQQQGQSQGQGENKDNEGNEQGQGSAKNINFDDHSNMEEATMSANDEKETKKEMKKGSKGTGENKVEDDGRDEEREKGKGAGNEDEADVKGTHQIGSEWNHSQGDPLDYAIKKMAIEYYTTLKMGRILKAIRSKMIANASSLRPTTNYSYKRHSRRKYPISKRYGTIYKGKSKIMKNKDLIVALDTSGSVSDADIETALKVINGFMSDWKFNIFLIQCDNEIHDVKYFTHNIRNITVKGRGGTNYQPVFDYIKKRWVQQGGEDSKQVMLVYIGDGQTSHNINSHGINTVWLFNTSYWKDFYENVKFGDKFVIPANAKERKIYG